MGESNSETSLGVHAGEGLARRLKKKERENERTVYEELVKKINTGFPSDEERQEALLLAHKLGINPTR